MTINYYLNNNKKLPVCPIRMHINHNGTNIRLSIGEKVNIYHWSTKKQRVTKNNTKEPYNFHNEINKTLDRFELKVKQLYYRCVANETPFTRLLIEDCLKNRLDDDLNSKMDFLQAFDEFLRYKKNEHAASTAKTYKAAKNKLTDYEKYNNVKLSFDNFDDKFYIDFQAYIFQVKKHQTNYFVNLMKKYMAVLNWSLDKEYHDNLKFKKWKLKESDAQIIYLTFQELNLLYNCNLEIDRHVKTRDFLIFQCDTGTRVSDFKSLTDANFLTKQIVYDDRKINAHWLNYVSVKTKKKVSLPLTNRAFKIYEKYILDHKKKRFPCYSDAKYNDYIKEVGELAGITKMTEKFYHSGSSHTKEVEPKYKLMSSKIGRKTFVSLHYQKDGDTKTIKGMTGHTTDKAFEAYCQDSEANKYKYIDRINEEMT